MLPTGIILKNEKWIFKITVRENKNFQCQYPLFLWKYWTEHLKTTTVFEILECYKKLSTWRRSILNPYSVTSDILFRNNVILQCQLITIASDRYYLTHFVATYWKKYRPRINMLEQTHHINSLAACKGTSVTSWMFLWAHWTKFFVLTFPVKEKRA